MHPQKLALERFRMLFATASWNPRSRRKLRSDTSGQACMPRLAIIHVCNKAKPSTIGTMTHISCTQHRSRKFSLGIHICGITRSIGGAVRGFESILE